MNIFVGREEPEAAQEINNTADADIPEKIFRGLGSAPPGLVNFCRSYRFGEGKFRIFNHHAAHERNKQNS